MKRQIWLAAALIAGLSAAGMAGEVGAATGDNSNNPPSTPIIGSVPGGTTLPVAPRLVTGVAIPEYAKCLSTSECGKAYAKYVALFDEKDRHFSAAKYLTFLSRLDEVLAAHSDWYVRRVTDSKPSSRAMMITEWYADYNYREAQCGANAWPGVYDMYKQQHDTFAAGYGKATDLNKKLREGIFGRDQFGDAIHKPLYAFSDYLPYDPAGDKDFVCGKNPAKSHGDKISAKEIIYIYLGAEPRDFLEAKKDFLKKLEDNKISSQDDIKKYFSPANAEIVQKLAGTKSIKATLSQDGANWRALGAGLSGGGDNPFYEANVQPALSPVTQPIQLSPIVANSPVEPPQKLPINDNIPAPGANKSVPGAVVTISNKPTPQQVADATTLVNSKGFHQTTKLVAAFNTLSATDQIDKAGADARLRAEAVVLKRVEAAAADNNFKFPRHDPAVEAFIKAHEKVLKEKLGPKVWDEVVSQWQPLGTPSTTASSKRKGNGQGQGNSTNPPTPPAGSVVAESLTGVTLGDRNYQKDQAYEKNQVWGNISHVIKAISQLGKRFIIKTSGDDGDFYNVFDQNGQKVGYSWAGDDGNKHPQISWFVGGTKVKTLTVFMGEPKFDLSSWQIKLSGQDSFNIIDRIHGDNFTHYSATPQGVTINLDGWELAGPMDRDLGQAYNAATKTVTFSNGRTYTVGQEFAGSGYMVDSIHPFGYGNGGMRYMVATSDHNGNSKYSFYNIYMADGSRAGCTWVGTNKDGKPQMSWMKGDCQDGTKYKTLTVYSGSPTFDTANHRIILSGDAIFNIYDWKKKIDFQHYQKTPQGVTIQIDLSGWDGPLGPANSKSEQSATPASNNNVDPNFGP